VVRNGREGEQNPAELLKKCYAKVYRRLCESLFSLILAFSLWEKARMRETPAIDRHPRTLTPTLSQREREQNP
jgi:hypothetical protein